MQKFSRIPQNDHAFFVRKENIHVSDAH